MDSRNLGTRRGASVVELALLIPLMAFLFVVAVDFGRVYYFSLTLQNCARSGALYASDPHVAHESPFSSVEEAVLADATNLDPQPTVSTMQGTDGTGHAYVEVSAAYPYRSITRFPGIPREMNLTRTVRMYHTAVIPEAY